MITYPRKQKQKTMIKEWISYIFIVNRLIRLLFHFWCLVLHSQRAKTWTKWTNSLKECKVFYWFPFSQKITEIYHWLLSAPQRVIYRSYRSLIKNKTYSRQSVSRKVLWTQTEGCFVSTMNWFVTKSFLIK